MGHIHPAVSEICDPQSLDPICGKFDKFWPIGKPIWGKWANDHDSAQHWNENVVILTKFSTLAAPEVAQMTTSSAASDENFIKMTTFSFQWTRGLDNCTELQMEKIRQAVPKVWQPPTRPDPDVNTLQARRAEG